MKHSTITNFRFWRGLWLAPLAVVFILSSGTVFAQEVVGDTSDELDAQAILDYWTPERMQNATVLDMEVAPDAAAAVTDEDQLPEGAVPGYAPGWSGKGPKPDPTVTYTLDDIDPLASPPFGSPSSSTDYINFAPYDRWTWYGNYSKQSTSYIGKLFGRTHTGANFQCSASLIGRRVIATAGHCVSDGRGNWYGNYMFCPSYFGPPGQPFPGRGCYAWTYQATSSTWFNNGNPGGFDRDYACIVTTGSPGNWGGWSGRAWNWPTRQHTTAWGYPSVSPFPGYHIITCASTEWYERNLSSGTGNSKYIGCDQTPGSSGGPWWFGIRHKNTSFNYAPLDNSNLTDPPRTLSEQRGGPFINGVNSHRRSGWVNEMGSPQFTNTAAGDDSEDVFAACYAND